MLGMRLGGIDPSILRELSGVYKPFVKAFKELVSNSFDADADNVEITFADDFSSVVLRDDGTGMNPFEFRTDFTRIGGGSRRWSGDRTRKGRRRIGSKGIGFLALARYCDRLWVTSTSNRDHEVSVPLETTSSHLDVRDLLGVPMTPKDLAKRIHLDVTRRSGREGKLRSSDFEFNQRNSKLSFSRDFGPVLVHLRVKCSDVKFKACLDFERLLKLADNADLEQLDDFTSIDIQASDAKERPGTEVCVDGLKAFVRKELRAERRKGFVRNVASKSGLEHLHWQLSRCTPVPYVPALEHQNSEVAETLLQNEKAVLKSISVRHAGSEIELKRPIYPYEPESGRIPSDMLVKVKIDERGLKATGFLAGYESVIFPAEFRGVSIRVRGIAIGEAGFLGAEHLLTGANRAALSQITGEINVTGGLDAVDTLNPGRESFYEESEHFKVLRAHLLGEGEQVTGLLGKVIEAVLRRSHVRSSLSDVLGRASTRRKALEDVSAAITHLIAQRDDGASALKKLLKSSRSHVNGLASAKTHELDVPSRIGGLVVLPGKGLKEAAEVDYDKEQIHLDMSRSEWDWSLLLFDRRFEVVHKRGASDQSIAEMDMKTRRIFINWGHPVKLQLDERGFIRTALAWVLAKEAASKENSQMMDLALKLLSFSTSSNG